MPLPRVKQDARLAGALRRQYELEKELARRLRDASKEDRRLLYGQVYDEFFRQVLHESGDKHFATDRASVALQATLLRPFLSPSTVFLEIGAGDCSLALRLADQVAKVYAVDASRQQQSRSSFPPNLRRVIDNGTRLEIAAQSVDVAYSCHFVEHLHADDLGDHLRAVHRVLVGGGVYILVTPNRLHGPHDVSKYFDDVACGLHLREYTHHELATAMNEAGFARVQALRGIGRPPWSWPTWPHRLLEGLLSPIPPGLRHRLLSSVPFAVKEPPLRPLEQVKLLGHK